MAFERRLIIKDIIEHGNNFNDKEIILINKRIVARLFDFSTGIQDTDFDFSIKVESDGTMQIKDNECHVRFYFENEALDLVKAAVDLAIDVRNNLLNKKNLIK